jgi:hypothetical protein
MERRRVGLSEASMHLLHQEDPRTHAPDHGAARHPFRATVHFARSDRDLPIASKKSAHSVAARPKWGCDLMAGGPSPVDARDETHRASPTHEGVPMRPPRLQFRLRGHRRKQHWRPAIRLVLVAAAASVMLGDRRGRAVRRGADRDQAMRNRLPLIRNSHEPGSR